MKKGLLLLVLAIVSAVVAAVLACHFHQGSSPVEWLRSEFGLNDEQMKQVEALHDGYRANCEAMCQRIADTDAKLAKAIKSGTSASPEIAAAIAETDRVRMECRLAMLRHFYQTAEVIPAGQRARYLEKVLPIVMHPEEMRSAHGQ